MSQGRTTMIKKTLTSLLAFAPGLAFAHTGHETQGIISGLLHPLLGWDHLLAMVAVGMLAVAGRERPVWQLPVLFVGFMLAGAWLGIGGVGIAGVETGIQLSLVVLGLMLAVGVGGFSAATMMCCALFGLLHGNAHGLELPAFRQVTGYVTGFMVATVALHGIGWLAAAKWHATLVRVTGAAMAGAGVLAAISAM